MKKPEQNKGGGRGGKKAGVRRPASRKQAPARKQEQGTGTLAETLERLRLSEERYRLALHDLEQRQRLLQTIIDAEPECVKILDRDGALVMMNAAGLAMIDAGSLEQVKGQKMSCLVTEEYREAFERLGRDVFSGKGGMLEFEAIGLEGRRVWLETHAVPLRNEKNEITGLLGVTRDVTQRKRVERALVEEKNRSEAIVAAMGHGISIQDREFRVLYQNEAHKNLVGSHVGRFCYEAYQKRDRVCDGCPVALTFVDGAVHTAERTGHTSRGALHVEITASPLRDASGAIIAGVEAVQDITHRKRAEASLRDSESRYRDLFENANDPIFILDADHRYMDVNEKATRVFGYSKEEFQRMSVFDLIPPEQAERSRRTFHALQEHGRYDDFEGKLRAKDGQWRDVQVSSSRIIINGVFAGSRDIVRDITERKRMEDALREEQGFTTTILDTVDALVLALDREARIVRFNRACEKCTGYTFEEVRGKHVWDLVIPPEQVPQVKDVFRRLTAGMFPNRHVNHWMARDGQRRLISWSNTALIDEHGTVQYVIPTGVDITERERAEDLVRNVLETVDEGFIIVNRDYSILSANKAYTTQVGKPLQEVLGKRCYEVSHGISRPCFEMGSSCAVRSVFLSGEPQVAVHTHHDGRGEPVYVETKAFPMKDATGRVTAVIEIVNNITERKRLEEQLRHAQKMEAVGLLAGGVAHDFNNILTAVIGYGNLLESKLETGDVRREYAEQILAAAARAASLTQSLLAFSRKQVITPRPIDINEIIARIEKLLHRVIGEDVEFRTILAAGELTILADSSQFEQVIMNLVTNARDAMDKGGTLTIETCVRELTADFKKQHGFGRPGTYACVTVRDTGRGMDDAVRERIFEPFFTTKELGRGTGLGLAIVYGIVKQNNGYIIVESEPGRGTMFSLYFPLTPAQAERRDGAAGGIPAARGSATVLLAEDDPALRVLLRTILAEYGYTVIEASDGEEAVKRFSENRDEVQLLILDVIMPRLNGREAYEEIKRLRSGVPTLFISGYSDDIVTRNVLFEEGCHYIAKPVAAQDLLAKVQQLTTSREPA